MERREGSFSFTNENAERSCIRMKLFWSEHAPFIELFGWQHLLYTGIMLLTLFLLVRYRTEVRRNRENIRKIILVVSIVQQVLLYSWYIFETGFDISESLPLHVSRISSLLGIYYLFTKNTKVMNVLFFFGLYAYGSFLVPSRVYAIYHIVGISFLVNHVVTILLPIFASIAYDWRPTFHSLFTSYGYFLFYFFFVFFLNPLIDGNYFYLKTRPFLQDLPGYIYNPAALVATFSLFLVGYYAYRAIEKKMTGKNLTPNKIQNNS